jgi:Leucine-rich repeat (LRR) protein
MLDLSLNRVGTLNPRYWFWDAGTIRHLDLSNNRIAEPFPAAMGNMTSLEALHLGDNFLTSLNPKALSNLCNLRELTLSRNRINQDLPEFLEGLPHCARSKMELLDLTLTNLSGEIPKWIDQWTNLRILQLSSNQLVGSIPREIGVLSKLSKLYLGGNQFNGSISEDHFGSLVNLEELDLSYNSLHMVISSNWTPPFKLQLAYFPSSKLGPHFPLWLKGQSDVTYLDISDAGIVDHLPDWFWTMSSNVQYLNISCNKISGTLPSTLEFMSSAMPIVLDLNSNMLTGSLPKLPRLLVELDISRNLLSGPLPQDFGAPFLSDLLLSENSINGTIPAHFCELQFFNILDLAKNRLIGRFPDCAEVSVGTKKLNATFSAEALILYGNNLSGDISFLQSCPELILLDLAHNKFTGGLPTWIAETVPYLSYLQLRHNMFFGSIPIQLTQLAYLQYLDLAYNRISGFIIPHALANMKAMTKDTGGLNNPLWSSYERPPGLSEDYGPPKYDDSLEVVTKGQNLDYTSSIIYMVGLDLSCNNLVGEIPVEITSLVNLKSLNISHNQFSGKIPENIGFLGSLESLDLSCNELSGGIPSSFSDMTMLSKLNLSYNNLSGRVPTGNQLQALIDPASSYIGNDYLCGPPLSRNCSGPEVIAGGDLDEQQVDTIFFNLGLAAGFVPSLWVVFVVLLFCKRLRVAYFKLFDKLLRAIQAYMA